MKKRILFLVAALALLLSACGGSPSSAMAEELSAKYDFYEKSAENIKKGFDVSADDADQDSRAVRHTHTPSTLPAVLCAPAALTAWPRAAAEVTFPWVC